MENTRSQFIDNTDDPRLRLPNVTCDHCESRAMNRKGPALLCDAHMEAVAEGRLIITTND